MNPLGSAIATSMCALMLTPPPAIAAGQEDASGARRSATAVRVADGTIRVDGRLDDQGWRQAIPVTDFVQKEPTEGAAPANPTEVYFAYDADALYVGARMHSRDAGSIQAPLGRRDTVEQSEYIAVFLDTYLDYRTAVGFGVTASGVRLDRAYSGDNEYAWDSSFDPVWEARTSRTDEGWTAELWIPFSQLRFNHVTEQIWGLNLERFTPTSRERDLWIATPRTDNRWSSQFGELRGIESVPPSRRMELSPYVASSSTLNADRNPANPFDDGKNLGGRVGADMKMGFGPNLTLDLTVNPDFGQVEADPAEVNLSGFETFFSEKRSFFIEGSRLLSLGQSFYSRRIGAPPSGSATGDFVDLPRTSTIATAAKLTGRLPSKTSIGILAALTNEETARVSVGDEIGNVRVGARTSYGLGRVQQEFGRSASSVSGIVTAVHRDVKPGDPLSALLARDAFTGAGQAVLRLHDGQYVIDALAGGTFIQGETAAIELLQRAGTRYLQRPDRNYARLDPTLTSLKGFSWTVDFDRVNARHWLYGVHWKVDSPGYDTNDIGRLRKSDGNENSFDIRYRETKVGRVFRSYAVGLSQSHEFNYGMDRQGGSVRQFANVTFRNFWQAGYSFSSTFRAQDAFITRGGPLMATPKGWNGNMYLSNSFSSRTGWNLNVSGSGNEDGGTSRRVNGGVTLRPAPRWRVQINPVYGRAVNTQQYVTTLSDGRIETYGNRYVFSHIESSTLSTQFRVGYTLRPDVNVDVYAEPFASSGRYYDYGELSAPGSRRVLVYGQSGTTLDVAGDGTRTVTDSLNSFTIANNDFNVRSFRSNLVLRWEYRPGSTLYVVWQQNRSQSLAGGRLVGVADMFDSLTTPGSNFFAIKMSFWIPVR